MSEIRLQTLKFKGLPDTYTIPSPVVAEDENSDGNVVIRKYNAVEDTVSIDKTLTIEGAAADAKAVGDRIKNITTSGDAPVLDAVLGADGIMTYNNSPAFDEWLTETEGKAMFAPSGYGLGEISGKTCTDANTATVIGFYIMSGSGATNVPAGYEYAQLTVTKRNFDIYQFLIQNGTILFRQSSDGGENWEEWSFVNPPMVLDVEYLTTERYMGYHVYTKLVNCGIPSNGKRVETGHGVIIRHSGNLNSNHSLPFNVNQSETSAYWAESQNEGATLILNCGTGFASNSYTWYEQIWWINS